MKRNLLVASGISLVAVLAFGAVKTYVVDPKTVSSAEELLSIFFEARESLPPIPSPISYEEVMNQLAEGRMDFVANTWAFPYDAGTYYLSDKSKLARELTLPMRLVAYEDLLSGTVVLAGTSEESEGLQILSETDAPEFSPYDEKYSLESYLMHELWPRRMIWTAILKSEEEAWADLIKAEEAASLSVAPMSMTMSMLETIADFRIIQDGTNLSVNLPDEFAGADITLERSTNLVSGGWATALQTNAPQSGVMFLTVADIPDPVGGGSSTNSGGGTIPPPSGTNTSSSSSSTSGGAAFYRASASSTVDSDSDGLDNISEYSIGTGYLNPDSDNDTMSDGWEVAEGLNPLLDDAANNPDNDLFSNKDEFDLGLNPFTNDMAVAGRRINYTYDALGRLTGTEAPESTDTTYIFDEEGNITGVQ